MTAPYRAGMRRLSPEEELANLRAIEADPALATQYSLLRQSFVTLHARAQSLLGLIALCLTITGFSGPKIAASGTVAAIGLAIGLLGALASAVVLLCGPLGLQWITAEQASDHDATLLTMLERRNARTARLRLAMALLVTGLSAYVVAVVWFLLTGI